MKRACIEEDNQSSSDQLHGPSPHRQLANFYRTRAKPQCERTFIVSSLQFRYDEKDCDLLAAKSERPHIGSRGATERMIDTKKGMSLVELLDTIVTSKLLQTCAGEVQGPQMGSMGPPSACRHQERNEPRGTIGHHRTIQVCTKLRKGN